MKRIIVTLLAVFFFMLGLSSCDSQSQEDPPEKSKEEIIADLNHSADFWFYVVPGQSSDIIADYTVKDIDIQTREKDENYDTIIGNVTAESSYATYTGTFLIKYLFQEDSGYSLYTVYQEVPGIYSGIKPPDDKFAEDYYSAHKAALLEKIDYYADLSSLAFENVSAKPINEEKHIYGLYATYTCRVTEGHCTLFGDICCTMYFENGMWNMGTVDNSKNITYDQVNQIYFETVTGYSNRVVLINAYVLDGIQYYDKFCYFSEAELNYADKITYGFEEIETGVPVTDSYIGQDSILCKSTGPIDEQEALVYLEQIKKQDDDLFIITDPKAYVATLPANINDPGYIIIDEQYVDDNGLNVATIVRRGTYGYEMATNNQ